MTRARHAAPIAPLPLQGALVAVKVLEHALEAPVVQQVRLQAALSMSISHPNVCATFKVCTCTVEPPLCAPLDEGSGGGSGEGSSGGAGCGAPRWLS